MSAAGRKPNPHSSAIKRVMRLTLETSGLPQKAVCLDLDIDSGTLSRYLSDEHPHVLPCDQLPGWVQSTGDAALLRTLAARCGYELAPTCDHHAIRATTTRLTGLLAQRSGSTVAHLIEAVADGTITPQEQDSLRPELLRLQSVVNALVDAMTTNEKAGVRIPA